SWRGPRRWSAPPPPFRPAWQPSQRLRRGQNLGGMALDLHLGPDPRHPARAVDQEGRAGDAEEQPAVKALLAPDPVILAGPAVLVGGEDDGKPVLPAEPVMRLHRIPG